MEVYEEFFIRTMAFRGLRGQDADDLLTEVELEYVDKELMAQVIAEVGELKVEDEIVPAYDPATPGLSDAMAWSLPDPGPDFTGLIAQCGEDPMRRKQAIDEIIEIWKRVAGPPTRPAKGYHVCLVNRITQAAGESQAHIMEVGDPEDGRTVTLMIFSIFSSRFLEYAAIASTPQAKDVRIWEVRSARWKDSWPGMQKPPGPQENAPLGYYCVRDKIVVDQFTAYFLGLVTDDTLPVREGSYAATFHEETGMPTMIEFDLMTDGMTDEQYAEMRAKMMQYATNAVTARVAAASFAAGMRETIKKMQVETAAAMLAKDTKRRLAKRTRAAPADVVELFQKMAAEARAEAQRLKAERLAREAAGEVFSEEEALEEDDDATQKAADNARDRLQRLEDERRARKAAGEVYDEEDDEDEQETTMTPGIVEID